jgi:formylglycine-generating enzyme required for sulfatase activity
MVVIPAGSFLMGSPASEEGRNEDEGPQRRVTIERFAMSKTAVTQREWKAVMGNNPSHFESCGGDCPVERVSWYDVQQYIRRLSEKTGQRYLLPSESEWEYAARGGTMTTYPWGNGVGSDRANCDGCGSEWDNKSTAPVKSFSPNRFGLHIIGNVWEWVQDCWDPHAYIKAPSDGTAYEPTTCPNRGLRGGSWYSRPLDARSASRYVGEGYKGSLYVGFRIAKVLPYTVGPYLCRQAHAAHRSTFRRAAYA